MFDTEATLTTTNTQNRRQQTSRLQKTHNTQQKQENQEKKSQITPKMVTKSKLIEHTNAIQQHMSSTQLHGTPTTWNLLLVLLDEGHVEMAD